MIEQHIEIINLPEVLTEFNSIDHGLISMKPLWERVEDEFHRQETDWFAAEPWAALSPAYAERKREIFGDKPILRATDALFRSLTEEGSTGNISRIGDLDAEFGTSDPKAMFHFLGTSRMPARDPLAEPNVERYATIAGEYLDRLVREAQI